MAASDWRQLIDGSNLVRQRWPSTAARSFKCFFTLQSVCAAAACTETNNTLPSPLLFFKTPPKKAFQEKTEISVATAPLPV